MRFPVVVSLFVFSVFLVPAVTRADDFRAAWVASVFNLNFPSRPGLAVDLQEAQIVSIVETADRSGLNALMVQVRPEGDALYDSHLEPWSRYLTGWQGTAPGYDPLRTFIKEGKRRGIAIHAWINPYRAAANAAAPLATSHEVYRLRDSVRRVGSSLWLDPGSSEVRQHVVKVVSDLVRNYDVAGLVLDDYFYPYPGKGYGRGTFPDSKSYARYVAGGGSLNREMWRRENVNALIRELRATVRAVRPGTAFGVSPFGIYTRGQPSDVTADLDQYHDLYADPVRWLREGWVDYLSPQLYWKNAGSQSYSALLRWWRSQGVNPRQVPIFPSIALERLGPGYDWPVTEIEQQLYLEKIIQPRSQGGFILWNVGSLLRNQKNVGSVVSAARG
jgi:uncharacterized lipoprotein YddW (UPF0748 family)